MFLCGKAQMTAASLLRTPLGLEGSSEMQALAVAHARGGSGSGQMAWHMFLSKCPPLDVSVLLPLACDQSLPSGVCSHFVHYCVSSSRTGTQ